jgi:NADH-quinone oxidoreductase subunit J
VNLSFYIIAVVTLASAIAAMSFRNLVHCALGLVGAFLGVAAMFLHLNAPFIAFAQVLVYVGAVAILIVFAILLTRNSEQAEVRSMRGAGIGIAIAVLVGVTIIGAIRSNPPKGTASDLQPTVHALGTKLMTTHAVPLEIAGLLLTAATIGAVVIALQEKPAK